jgi:hypothetical protein
MVQASVLPVSAHRDRSEAGQKAPCLLLPKCSEVCYVLCSFTICFVLPRNRLIRITALQEKSIYLQALLPCVLSYHWHSFRYQSIISDIWRDDTCHFYMCHYNSCDMHADEEAEKKQKRAAQLADFDLLGSEPPAVAQPRRVHTKVTLSCRFPMVNFTLHFICSQ